jgi:hypothetical protein
MDKQAKVLGWLAGHSSTTTMCVYITTHANVVLQQEFRLVVRNKGAECTVVVWVRAKLKHMRMHA